MNHGNEKAKVTTSSHTKNIGLPKGIRYHVNQVFPIALQSDSAGTNVFGGVAKALYIDPFYLGDQIALACGSATKYAFRYFSLKFERTLGNNINASSGEIAIAISDDPMEPIYRGSGINFAQICDAQNNRKWPIAATEAVKKEDLIIKYRYDGTETEYCLNDAAITKAEESDVRQSYRISIMGDCKSATNSTNFGFLNMMAIMDVFGRMQNMSLPARKKFNHCQSVLDRLKEYEGIGKGGVVEGVALMEDFLSDRDLQTICGAECPFCIQAYVRRVNKRKQAELRKANKDKFMDEKKFNDRNELLRQLGLLDPRLYQRYLQMRDFQAELDMKSIQNATLSAARFGDPSAIPLVQMMAADSKTGNVVPVQVSSGGLNISATASIPVSTSTPLSVNVSNTVPVSTSSALNVNVNNTVPVSITDVASSASSSAGQIPTLSHAVNGVGVSVPLKVDSGGNLASLINAAANTVSMAVQVNNSASGAAKVILCDPDGDYVATSQGRVAVELFGSGSPGGQLKINPDGTVPVQMLATATGTDSKQYTVAVPATTGGVPAVLACGTSDGGVTAKAFSGSTDPNNAGTLVQRSSQYATKTSDGITQVAVGAQPGCATHGTSGTALGVLNTSQNGQFAGPNCYPNVSMGDSNTAPTLITTCVGVIDATNFGSSDTYVKKGATVDTSNGLKTTTSSGTTLNANVVSVNGSTFSGSSVPAKGTISGNVVGYVAGAGRMAANSGGTGDPSISGTIGVVNPHGQSDKKDLSEAQPLNEPRRTFSEDPQWITGEKGKMVDKIQALYKCFGDWKDFKSDEDAEYVKVIDHSAFLSIPVPSKCSIADANRMVRLLASVPKGTGMVQNARYNFILELYRYAARGYGVISEKFDDAVTQQLYGAYGIKLKGQNYPNQK